MREIYNRSKGRRDAEVIKPGQAINGCLHLLCQMGETGLDEQIADGDLRQAIFTLIPRDKLSRAVQECKLLAQPEDYNFLSYVSGSYSYVRQFGPRFLATRRLRASEGDEALFRAVAYLCELKSGTRLHRPA